MNCPVCKDVTLQIAQRQNIEIDYCPNCRGVWLDRGELDKIIERSASERYDDDDNHRRSNYESPQRYDDDKRHYPKKKKSFLDEVFDIF